MSIKPRCKSFGIITANAWRSHSEQREYCLKEIERVEGYDRAEHEADTDEELARNVLGAWTDYCRDKGLL